MRLGSKTPQETRDKISKANTGKIRTQEAKDRLSESHKGQIAWNKGLTKELDPRIIGPYVHSSNGFSTERWSDPVWAEKTMKNALKTNQTIRPNKPEKRVIEILRALDSDIEYVGDGKCWILGTSKNPDFVNEDKKQIIEVFGCYWHGCLKHFPNKQRHKKSMARIAEFKRLGHSVLVIWECELKYSKKVMVKIKKFGEGLE